MAVNKETGYNTASPFFNDLYLKLQAKGLLNTELVNLDSKTPPEVIITKEAREPIWDSTLGIKVDLPSAQTEPAHRLVTIGDSLTHGFQSGAIFNTDLSYPSIIAYEMGSLDRFRYPKYRGFGGLPLNIEYLVRDLERKFGAQLNWWELAPAAFEIRHQMGEIENWWERGPGSNVQQFAELNHNLAIYGWDLRDTLSRTARICKEAIAQPKYHLLLPLVENANERTALRVLNYLDTGGDTRNNLSPLGQAQELGNEGGIETLIIFIGANNALPSILHLKVLWSGNGYDDLEKKNQYTVWNPVHFEKELDKVVAEVKKINARHVIWCTVPHVTIAPLARGVGGKVRKGSRYFPFYTRPWIMDSSFDDKEDPHLTEQEARAIDSAIDQYNYCIANAVEQARKNEAPKDWLLLDVAGILDRLACRRYADDPQARPSWWHKYKLPPELMHLNPVPDSRFFTTDAVSGERQRGGLFSLDGVHPTTIAYGLLAQEFINVMQGAGVKFYLADGVTERQSPVRVDFQRLINLDTLISDPPRSISSDLSLIGWFNQKLDFIRRILN